MKTYYCNPMNLPYRYQFEREFDPASGIKPPYKVYREAADPTLILFKGKYYLFPSMTGGFFTSDDLRDWEFHTFIGNNCVYDYAPDARAVGDYLYLCASKMGNENVFYRTKDPLSEPFEEIPVDYTFWDPDLFQDDDGRLYLYYGSSSSQPIFGVELDPETMRQIGEPKGLLNSNDKVNGYERNGQDHIPAVTEEQIAAQIEGILAGMKAKAEAAHEDMGMTDDEARALLRNYFNTNPYIEGAWMTKHDGKYYLQYAMPGTQFNVYGDAVFVADHPLGPFHQAKNNPYSYQPGGFITGAGHGSTLEDKNGNWWHISSQLVGINQKFERRLGLWKAGFDAEGELYCDQRFGDWPIRFDTVPFADPEIYLLSYGKKVAVSSGVDGQNITDENIRTWWQAAPESTSVDNDRNEKTREQTGMAGTKTEASGMRIDRSEANRFESREKNAPEWAEIDLGEVCAVKAIQVNFVDGKAETDALPNGEEPWPGFNEERWMDPETQPLRWILEGSEDGTDWHMICDKSKVDTDLPHDFIELDQEENFKYIRLTILKTPYDNPACVAGIRVFGHGNGNKPEQAKEVCAVVRENEMDMDVSWKADHAVGAAVCWGYHPDALYHCRMVYGSDSVSIGALVKGQKTYVRVDTFNENGVTRGNVETVK